jgi:hypothetical protein
VTEKKLLKMDQDKCLYDKQSSSDFRIIDPNGRLKVLSDFGNSIEIDSNIPPRRYGLPWFLNSV